MFIKLTINNDKSITNENVLILYTSCQKQICWQISPTHDRAQLHRKCAKTVFICRQLDSRCPVTRTLPLVFIIWVPRETKSRTLFVSSGINLRFCHPHPGDFREVDFRWISVWKVLSPSSPTPHNSISLSLSLSLSLPPSLPLSLSLSLSLPLAGFSTASLFLCL